MSQTSPPQVLEALDLPGRFIPLRLELSLLIMEDLERDSAPQQMSLEQNVTF